MQAIFSGKREIIHKGLIWQESFFVAVWQVARYRAAMGFPRDLAKAWRQGAEVAMVLIVAGLPWLVGLALACHEAAPLVAGDDLPVERVRHVEHYLWLVGGFFMVPLWLRYAFDQLTEIGSRWEFDDAHEKSRSQGKQARTD